MMAKADRGWASVIEFLCDVYVQPVYEFD